MLPAFATDPAALAHHGVELGQRFAKPEQTFSSGQTSWCKFGWHGQRDEPATNSPSRPRSSAGPKLRATMARQTAVPLLGRAPRETGCYLVRAQTDRCRRLGIAPVWRTDRFAQQARTVVCPSGVLVQLRPVVIGARADLVAGRAKITNNGSVQKR